MKFIFQWVIAALAVGVASYLVPSVSVTLSGAVIAAVVLGALNLLVRPILFALTLPITILTLGLFSIVLNALMVVIAATVVPGFSVPSFWSALVFAVVLAVVNWLFHLWNRD